MFSFQFGTFESSTPGWFDWLSLFVSGLSIFVAFWLGERTFRKEKNDRETEEKRLADNELKFFEKSLNELVCNIEILKNNINNTITKHLNVFESEFRVNANFIKFLNLNRLYHREKEKTTELNDVLFYLLKIETINSDIDKASIRFVDYYSQLSKNYKNIQKEFEFKKNDIFKKNVFNQGTSMGVINNQQIINNFIKAFSKVYNDYFSSRTHLTLKFTEKKVLECENFYEKIEKICELYNFKESNEMKILCIELKSVLDDIQNLEKSHIHFLNNCNTILDLSIGSFKKYLN